MGRHILLLLMTVLLLVGCSKQTEEQRLSKFRGSMKYRAYRLSSETTTKLAVAGYNAATTQKVDRVVIHATLGLLWFLSEKSEYSFAEADIFAASDNNNIKLLSLGLQSIALSKMKYPNLARSHYSELKATLAAQQNMDANNVEIEHKLMLLSLIAVSIYHGDPDLAKFGADALSAITQLDYLPPLVGAVVDAKKGSPIKALDQLRELNKSDRFSEHKNALLAEVVDIIGKCPDKEKLGDELTNRVLIQLARRVLDDIFTAENQRILLEKTKTLPDLITGKTTVQPTAADSSSVTPQKVDGQ